MLPAVENGTAPTVPVVPGLSPTGGSGGPSLKEAGARPTQAAVATGGGAGGGLGSGSGIWMVLWGIVGVVVVVMG